jgi:hypothetical protein
MFSNVPEIYRFNPRGQRLETIMITRRAFLRRSAGTAAGLILPTWLIKAENYIEATKQFLLGHGFTIIQYSDRYFDYMKNDRFGHFTVDSYNAFSLSSSYKPCRAAGTGCQSVDHAWAFSLAEFERTLNYLLPSVRGDDVTFYRNLDDRVAQHWAKDKDTFKVTYPQEQS